MSTQGGLSLVLRAGSRDDRRIRSARVAIRARDSPESVELVTDARGRMRYRLADGEYLLSLSDGPSITFEVRDRRWTPVRLALA